LGESRDQNPKKGPKKKRSVKLSGNSEKSKREAKPWEKSRTRRELLGGGGGGGGGQAGRGKTRGGTGRGGGGGDRGRSQKRVPMPRREGPKKVQPVSRTREEKGFFREKGLSKSHGMEADKENGAKKKRRGSERGDEGLFEGKSSTGVAETWRTNKKNQEEGKNCHLLTGEGGAFSQPKNLLEI